MHVARAHRSDPAARPARCGHDRAAAEPGARPAVRLAQSARRAAWSGRLRRTPQWLGRGRDPCHQCGRGSAASPAGWCRPRRPGHPFPRRRPAGSADARDRRHPPRGSDAGHPVGAAERRPDGDARSAAPAGRARAAGRAGGAFRRAHVLPVACPDAPDPLHRPRASCSVHRGSIGSGAPRGRTVPSTSGWRRRRARRAGARPGRRQRRGPACHGDRAGGERAQAQPSRRGIAARGGNRADRGAAARGERRASSVRDRAAPHLHQAGGRSDCASRRRAEAPCRGDAGVAAGRRRRGGGAARHAGRRAWHERAAGRVRRVDADDAGDGAAGANAGSPRVVRGPQRRGAGRGAGDGGRHSRAQPAARSRGRAGAQGRGVGARQDRLAQRGGAAATGVARQIAGGPHAGRARDRRPQVERAGDAAGRRDGRGNG